MGLKTATSLGRSGLQDWLLQRVTAVILALYTAIMVGYWLLEGFHYDLWQTFFSHPVIQYSTLLALLSLIVHAWIGLWTISTDYIKSVSLRLGVQCLCGMALLYYLVWGIKILWKFE